MATKKAGTAGKKPKRKTAPRARRQLTPPAEARGIPKSFYEGRAGQAPDRAGQAAGVDQARSGLKVVVLFEGRDAAGKGGVIKRITQSLNPRVCRVVALPAPTEREKTQWYFQRYVPHLPAAGEMVLFDRSWYNRAGVDRVMGFCTEEEVEEFFRSCPEFERMLVRSGIILDQVLVLGQRRGAGAALPGAHRRPHQALEAQPHGPGVARPLGGVLQGQGRDVRATPTSSRRPGTWSTPTTSAGPGSTASATCSRSSPTRTSRPNPSRCHRGSRRRATSDHPRRTSPSSPSPTRRRPPGGHLATPAWPGPSTWRRCGAASSSPLWPPPCRTHLGRREEAHVFAHAVAQTGRQPVAGGEEDAITVGELLPGLVVAEAVRIRADPALLDPPWKACRPARLSAAA